MGLDRCQLITTFSTLFRRIACNEAYFREFTSSNTISFFHLLGEIRPRYHSNRNECVLFVGFESGFGAIARDNGQIGVFCGKGHSLWITFWFKKTDLECRRMKSFHMQWFSPIYSKSFWQEIEKMNHYLPCQNTKSSSTQCRVI